MQYRKREVITAVSILVAALAIIFYVIPNYIDMEEEFELASLSPAFFPNLSAWIISALACWLAISTLWQPKKTMTDDGDEEWLSRSEERNACKAALVIAVYVLAMKYIGFLIATVLVLVVLLVLQDIKKPLHMVLISILVTGGVFLFFYFIILKPTMISSSSNIPPTPPTTACPGLNSSGPCARSFAARPSEPVSGSSPASGQALLLL